MTCILDGIWSPDDRLCPNFKSFGILLLEADAAAGSVLSGSMSMLRVRLWLRNPCRQHTNPSMRN
jgi:hypothetical protein